jgi:hypothetical protein
LSEGDVELALRERAQQDYRLAETPTLPDLELAAWNALDLDALKTKLRGAASFRLRSRVALRETLTSAEQELLGKCFSIGMPMVFEFGDVPECSPHLLLRVSLSLSGRDGGTLKLGIGVPDLIDVRDDDTRAAKWDEVLRRTVSPGPYFALQALRESARKRKGVLSFPSLEALGRRMRCSRRTAIRRLGSLENAGIVYTYRVGSAVNAYAFAFPPTAALGDDVLVSLLVAPTDRVVLTGPQIRAKLLRPGERLPTHRV